MKLSRLELAGLIIVIAAVYFASAELGLSLASLHKNVTPVWPPTGIAIASLLIFGWRVWPAVLIGAIAANLPTHVSTPIALGVGLGNALEALVAFSLLSKRSWRPKLLNSVAGVLRFVLYAAVLAPMVSATIGNLSLCLGGAASWGSFPALWITWWLGDCFGALIIAPLLLAWSSGQPVNTRFVPEFVVWLLILLLPAMIIFGGWFPGSVKTYPLAYLCLPVLIWGALNFDQRIVTSGIVLLAGVALWGASRGYGPFIQRNPNVSLLLLLAFVGTSSLMTLMLFAATNERKRAEAEKLTLGSEVARQRRRIEDIVAHVPGVVWEAWGEPDAATQRIDFVSDHVETMLGYSIEEWLGTPNFWLSIVHEEDKERAGREAVARFKSARGGTSEFRWVARDGSILWVEARSTVITDEHGKPIGMRGVTLDISDRKRAEEALKESEQRYRDLVENVHDIIYTHDLKGDVTSVNAAVEQITGYTREEALRMNVAQTI